jgi:hypothetical protein
MKKWLFSYLIFNLLAFSLPSSYILSIFKIGGLVSHFQEHVRIDPKMNFLSFLASHYLEKHHQEANQNDHEKLPFHDHQGESLNFASQSLSLQPEHLSTFDFTKLIIHTDIVVAEITTCPSSSYPGDIWQPPKA